MRSIVIITTVILLEAWRFVKVVYVSCSSLMSSVGETKMILLGFREESLASELEKEQSPIISQCNNYLFAFIVLSSHVYWWHLSFTSSATPDKVEVGKAIIAVIEGCHKSCWVPDVSAKPSNAPSTCRPSSTTDLSPMAQFTPRHLRGTVPHLGATAYED